MNWAEVDSWRSVRDFGLAKMPSIVRVVVRTGRLSSNETENSHCPSYFPSTSEIQDTNKLPNISRRFTAVAAAAPALSGAAEGEASATAGAGDGDGDGDAVAVAAGDNPGACA